MGSRRRYYGIVAMFLDYETELPSDIILPVRDITLLSAFVESSRPRHIIVGQRHRMVTQIY